MQWGDQPVTPKGRVTDGVGHGVISKGQVNSQYTCVHRQTPQLSDLSPCQHAHADVVLCSQTKVHNVSSSCLVTICTCTTQVLNNYIHGLGMVSYN